LVLLLGTCIQECLDLWSVVFGVLAKGGFEKLHTTIQAFKTLLLERRKSLSELKRQAISSIIRFHPQELHLLTGTNHGEGLDAKL